MLDLTKPVQTRDGRKARIVCTDRKGAVPLVVLVTDDNGDEEPRCYTSDGLWFFASAEIGDHLVNVPERHKHADVIIAWANFAWKDTCGPTWSDECEYRVKP